MLCLLAISSRPFHRPMAGPWKVIQGCYGYDFRFGSHGLVYIGLRTLACCVHMALVQRMFNAWSRLLLLVLMFIRPNDWASLRFRILHVCMVSLVLFSCVCVLRERFCWVLSGACSDCL